MSHRRDRVELQFNEGEIIFKEGQSGNKLFIIQSGTVVLTKSVEDEEYQVVELGPGEVFGEMSLVDERPRSATARAVTPVVCQSISKAIFRSKFRNEVPSWMRSLYLSVVQRLRITTMRSATGGGDIPARQIVEVLGNYLERGKQTYSGATYISWAEAVQRVAFVLDTSEKMVEGIMEILVHSPLASFEVDLETGKRFLTKAPETLLQFCDYCWDSFMVDSRKVDKKREQQREKNHAQEMELIRNTLSVLEATTDQQSIGKDSLFELLEKKFNQSRKPFDSVLKRLMEGGLVAEDDEQGVPGMLVVNISLCRQEITRVEMSETFEELLRQIMRMGKEEVPEMVV